LNKITDVVHHGHPFICVTAQPDARG